MAVSKTIVSVVSVWVAVGLLARTASAIIIETVPVGDIGNAADRTGYGSVGYTYNIGKYEVTAGQYTKFLNAVAGVDEYGLYNTAMSSTTGGSGITRNGGGTTANRYTYSVASDFLNRPVNNVSYWDACRFANWLHNGQPVGAQSPGTTETGAYTLTADGITNNTVIRNVDWQWAVSSEDEWYKAAYYKGGSTDAGYWDYPTGSDTAPGRDLADASGANANYHVTAGPYPIDSGKYTTVVGEFENSDSPYGTFDQGGNVWEWNESVISGSSHGLRGGSFSNNESRLLASYRNSASSTTESNGFGFRVVQAEAPEPATLSLLAIAALFIRRRPRP